MAARLTLANREYSGPCRDWHSFRELEPKKKNMADISRRRNPKRKVNPTELCMWGLSTCMREYGSH